jgi:hypothetical protein
MSIMKIRGSTCEGSKESNGSKGSKEIFRVTPSVVEERYEDFSLIPRLRSG